MMEPQRLPIAKEGLPFVIGAVIVAVFFGVIGWMVLAFFGLVLTAFIAYFFRSPERKIPTRPNAILAPADGKIIHIGEVDEERFLKQRVMKVSIFMSLFDVHVNRAPVSGKVIQRSYRPGKFLTANHDKASVLNEQNAIIVEMENRFQILVVQIAGLVARRIVCYPKAGDSLQKGEIFGLIRFGSRVDLYLPLAVRYYVKVGQSVKGGETILGYY
jgi:phosphatidylserine decarboxylase